MLIRATEYHKELQKANLPICGVSSDGRIHWKETPTQAQLAKAKSLLVAKRKELEGKGMKGEFDDNLNKKKGE